MLYELRHYRIKNGKMKQWVKLFEEEIVPLQVSHGMVIAGSFTAVKEKNLFVWLRRFANETERTKLYAKVYESEQWKKVLQPKIDAVLSKSEIVMTLLTPTRKSILQ
jgi:hypothetical protein